MMRLAIAGSGMVTPVGYDAPATCAAIRCALDNFRKSAFKVGGKWLPAGWVDVDPKVHGGDEKFVWMTTRALDESMASAPGSPEDTAIAFCLPEENRPGRLDRFDAKFFANVVARSKVSPRFGPHRKLLQRGGLGGVEALQWAEQILSGSGGDVRYCAIVGVDSYVNGPTLEAYFHAGRLMVGETKADGFFPGEAATAVVVSAPSSRAGAMECLGIGWGRERATRDSDQPLRGDGLAMAYKAAFKSAGCGYEAVDYRLADIGGDQYAFKEAALGVLRTMRVRKKHFYLWHPADCVGRVGAASVPLILGIAAEAAARSYAPGPGVLCHFTEDEEIRAAVVLRDSRPRAPGEYA